MTSSSILYKNVLLYASLQFCGNIEEYFKNHTASLLVFIVMPRVKNKFNIIRFYKNGKLIEEKKVPSSENIIIYYLLWYIQYLKAIIHFFPKKEKIIVIAFHPLTFLFMTVQKLIRNIQFVYWVGDYFPGINISLKLYERMKKFYHKRVDYTYYLSDRINEKMNGTFINTQNSRTIMWGVKPKRLKRISTNRKFKVLFVGLIKPSQGIENILLFLRDHKDYNLKILGICEEKFYIKLQDLINIYGITKQVYFPNVFVSDEQLEKESEDCSVGVALYDMNPLNATNYADPGKVKSYAELGLPIIMSNISDVTRYVKKFRSGVVIDRYEDLEQALLKVANDYKDYKSGIQRFNDYFYFETYYKKSFVALERLWQNNK